MTKKHEMEKGMFLQQIILGKMNSYMWDTKIRSSSYSMHKG